MKKILAIFLLAGVTFALFPQAADNQPKESQPIVVGGTDAGPASTPVVRTITTKKAYTQTVSVPETTTTVAAPDRVLVREAALSWISLGLRLSADYYLSASDGALSPLWLYGEFYNTSWGIEMGVGRTSQPLPSGFTPIGQAGTAAVTAVTGTRSVWQIDALFKYYMWFARWLWVGAGLGYNTYDSAFLYSSTTGNTYSIPVFMKSQLLWEAGLGIKVALGSGFNVVHFEPNFRVMGPFVSDGAFTNIPMLRLNLGFTYSFGL